MNVTMDIESMFHHIDPWDVSNSVANLGPRAAELTRNNALAIAAGHRMWLHSPLADTYDAIQDDAAGTGAWKREEIEAWSVERCLAYLVQCVASDLRLIGSDDLDFAECLEAYESTDWEAKGDYPILALYRDDSGKVFGEYYLGT